jgi:hypothetical protein
MMRNFVAVLAGCLMLATAQAQSPQPEPAETRDKSTVSADDAVKPAAPAPVFTPSEKIRADSAVSFPVDI